jgi:hypothetical protein
LDLKLCGIILPGSLLLLSWLLSMMCPNIYAIQPESQTVKTRLSRTRETGKEA